jgi:hypothetical protein
MLKFIKNETAHIPIFLETFMWLFKSARKAKEEKKERK